jgi:hypothetical protein
MDWQPIETAQKIEGGIPILVFVPDSADTCGGVFMADWSDTRETWRIYIDDGRLNPTHWMPLPNPPA